MNTNDLDKLVERIESPTIRFEGKESLKRKSSARITPLVVRWSIAVAATFAIAVSGYALYMGGNVKVQELASFEFQELEFQIEKSEPVEEPLVEPQIEVNEEPTAITHTKKEIKPQSTTTAEKVVKVDRQIKLVADVEIMPHQVNIASVDLSQEMSYTLTPKQLSVKQRRTDFDKFLERSFPLFHKDNEGEKKQKSLLKHRLEQKEQGLKDSWEELTQKLNKDQIASIN